MHTKHSRKGDGPVSRPVRTSNRIKRRPKVYGRTYFLQYTPAIIHTRRNKPQTRTTASSIAKILCPGNLQSITTNLRRSTRKRKLPVNLEGYAGTYGSDEEEFTNPVYQSLKDQIGNNEDQNELPSPKRGGIAEDRSMPRREGLRPRYSKAIRGDTMYMESEDEEESSGEKVRREEAENGNDVDDDLLDVHDDGEVGDDADGEGEEEGDEDGDDEGEEEEQEGRRRYDLRNRADVRRFSIDQSKQQSPKRILHQGVASKINNVRKNGARVHKRHQVAEDSDDSLLVDELDQGQAAPWARGGNRCGPPWLLGGFDMHGTTSWGLGVAASGWGHQGDTFSTFSGFQTAGPSSKGGADIQPVQVDESVGFDEIGGLSEYVSSLKEMVFFPLLYPDFFSTYNIAPPRGVLLCGPPGTGKTLIARALACAASKAGQKVTFYMRKGADVLSKWVGEAERQLKLLFEEAQKNQPSIIFFDEIDGLAPVRSSKQEQIHNSIVSTLLALMDGLDSRGQVVLIGATNRIDAIDGALRRPGRFDREFHFPLPGYEARAEIIDIHTRKWKQPPSRETKMELAASCVGYCGADLKALCTEAAICAFREKYPQVYTSDDKFLIDVDSIKVGKNHFLNAMSTINPAAHRGAVVHARPLSLVVAPCLQSRLQQVMSCISNIFPPLSTTMEFSKLSRLSYGRTIPLIYRPRLLLCGGEFSGLDHLGPAVLHELEKFPIHSLGLASLLSDPGAKTPEEALVHVFCEARRTTPSILYVPQFSLWWDNAHEQLRAVLLTLLDELPSDLPILLLGTSALTVDGIDGEPLSVFPHHSIFQVGKPSVEDRSLFFDRLIDVASSVFLDGEFKKFPESSSLPELPKLPKVTSGPKPSELKAKAEAEQHSLRRMRMCLRDVCNRILCDRRFIAFHYPVMDEDAPNYHSVIENPVDMATMLQRVDSAHYVTCSSFLHDIDLIILNAKAYNGNDYNGARIVSRAYELRDAVNGMLSQMDPALVVHCDNIAAQGGPTQLPDDLAESIFPCNPILQHGVVTRATSRQHNPLSDVNPDLSHDPLKKQKKMTNVSQIGNEEDAQLGSEEKLGTDIMDLERPESSSNNGGEIPCPPAADATDDADDADATAGKESEEGTMSKAEILNHVEYVKSRFLEHTMDHGIANLERLYARIMKGVLALRDKKESQADPHCFILKFLVTFVENKANF